MSSTKPIRKPKAENHPIAWFSALLRGVDQGKPELVETAKRHLECLGYSVVSMPPLPDGVSGLDDVLTEAMDGIAARAAAEMKAAGIVPMVKIETWAAVLGCSRRHIERMRNRGELPEPVYHVGEPGSKKRPSPRWTADQLRRWIDAQSRTSSRRPK